MTERTDQDGALPGHEVEATTDEVCPFSRQELRGMLRAPLRTMDLVLAQRRRFAMNIAHEHRLPTMLLVLSATTLLFALPFGAVLGLAQIWRVAVLLLGALCVCLPSLHVFGRYLGARLSWMQTLCVSLSATAVAALFTFAFAPVMAFLRLTMTGADVVTPQGIAVLLLVCSVSAGIGHLLRLLRGEAVLRGLGPSMPLVLLPWLGLYAFITVRLAGVLGLP
jgi:hypothetical protein